MQYGDRPARCALHGQHVDRANDENEAKKFVGKLPLIVGHFDKEREHHERDQTPEGISAEVNGQFFMSGKQKEEGVVEAVRDKPQCLDDRVDEQQDKCKTACPFP